MTNTLSQPRRILGFTLIELMVSISIVAVLMAIGVVSYTQANRSARNARRASDMEQVRAALELYRNENPSYPATPTEGDFSILVELLKDDGFLSASSNIVDPKSSDEDFAYSYFSPPPDSGDGSVCETYALCFVQESNDGNSTQCVCNP